MTLEAKPNGQLPDWAQIERERDMKFLQAHLDVFWVAASTVYEEAGRGAIVIDAMQWVKGDEIPDQLKFGFLKQEKVEQRGDADITRMVREYDPLHELVVVLLKPQDHTSSYRLSVHKKEKRTPKLLDDELRAQLPPLYSNEALGLEALALAKFFTPDAHWTWYPSEFDGEDIFFGLVAGDDVELGYFSLSELEEVRGRLGLPVERDRYFKPTTLGKLQEQHAG